MTSDTRRAFPTYKCSLNKKCLRLGVQDEKKNTMPNIFNFVFIRSILLSKHDKVIILKLGLLKYDTTFFSVQFFLLTVSVSLFRWNWLVGCLVCGSTHMLDPLVMEPFEGINRKSTLIYKVMCYQKNVYILDV